MDGNTGEQNLRCPYCGQEIPPTATKCPQCGAVIEVAGPHSGGRYVEDQSNGKGFAVTSLVLGILGLVCCCSHFTGSVLAIVFGCIAKGRMKRTGNRDGSDMATAGIVLGIIGIIFWIVGAAVWLVLMVFSHGFRHWC
jgi:hypothetical protein